MIPQESLVFIIVFYDQEDYRYIVLQLKRLIPCSMLSSLANLAHRDTLLALQCSQNEGNNGF